ncbi:hypothetical protein D3C78_27910 [compost metagenome]
MAVGGGVQSSATAVCVLGCVFERLDRIKRWHRMSASRLDYNLPPLFLSEERCSVHPIERWREARKDGGHSQWLGL